MTLARNSAMRDELKRAYSSPNWEEKVDKMPDNQVAAVLQRLKDQGKIK